MLADKVASDLMVKVAPLIGDMQVLLGEPLYRLPAPIALLLLARYGTLRPAQGGLNVAVVARRRDLSPIRCH
jgi:hypothetical protein